MKKRKNLLGKMLSIIMLCTFFVGIANIVYAAGDTGSSFWTQASEWYSQGSTNTYLDESVLSSIANLIEVAGTAIIAIATVVVGIKYVLGSVTEKSYYTSCCMCIFLWMVKY